eukprot:NODE_25576_length_582_cov_3.041758.p3 GENE.NODE_25576_length_582_cov_3.041758~~NODE_25576_length_582_cov_3.041758.p3  ORF type:complete len:63 (+),score=14.82 NODE_25576_length_582_cov_3.041758:196-384(+)
MLLMLLPLLLMPRSFLLWVEIVEEEATLAVVIFNPLPSCRGQVAELTRMTCCRALLFVYFVL